MIVNNYVNAAVAGFFMLSVVVILADSLRVWLSFRRRPVVATVDNMALEAT
jgi:hypothetical protein